MPYSSSQEQTIYRHLAGQIQLGFYDGGARFPSAQEIARKFRVSYCPAQRALKALAQAGLVQIGRGKETVVLRKPYEDYLQSDVFQSRAAAIADLCRSLAIISPAVTFQGMCRLHGGPPDAWTPEGCGQIGQWRQLYDLFGRSLAALGSRTLLGLYYDISALTESAFLDIMHVTAGEKGGRAFVYQLGEMYLESYQSCQNGALPAAKARLEELNRLFFARIGEYFAQLPPADGPQTAFAWAPHKGRTRYCDLIAVDLLCKVRQGRYPLDTRLPHAETLADIYHVSPITIRRAIALLNQLGLTQTVNGVGTYVRGEGDAATWRKLKALAPDDSLRSFLEALQLLAITCGPVLGHTFPHMGAQALRDITQAAALPDANDAVIGAVGACLQAVVRCSPLAAVREIYSNLTLLLLNGSVLHLGGLERAADAEGVALAQALAKAAASGDGADFAGAAGRLAEHLFLALKSHLTEIGATEVGPVAAPVHCD